jgi:WD40 repeat protein
VEGRPAVPDEALTDRDAEGSAPETSERRRIEIVHESLLTKWPRLVRWRMQDEEGAQLRDQLRQAARLWKERGRPDDLLWAGTSFKEYELWRERYEGGLSEAEEQFARAMSSRAARHKRRRRLAVAAVVTIAVGVAAVTSSLWRRSEAARDQAVAAARRAEASNLLALARLELEVDVTAALAYATASLGLADTPEARFFALRALATSPPATVLRAEEAEDGWTWPDFSPDGEWMTLNGLERLEVIGRDGTNRRLLGRFPSTAGMVVSRFSPEGDRLLATKGGELRIWSVPGFEQVHARQIPVPREGSTGELQETTSGLFLVTLETNYTTLWTDAGLWPLLTPLSFDGEPGDPMRLVGVEWMIHVHPSGRRLAYQPMDEKLRGWPADGPSPEVWVRSLADRSAPPRLLGRNEATIASLCWHPDGGSIAVLDRSGEIRFWPSDAQGAEPLRTLRGVEGSLTQVLFDATGEQLVVWGRVAGGNRYELWDLSAPVEARPAALTLPRSGAQVWETPAFSPDGRWLTTSHPAGRALWPVARERPLVLAIPGDQASLDMDVAFTDRGRLVSTSHREVREWDLSPGGQNRVLAPPLTHVLRLAVDPAGRFVVATRGASVVVVPVDGGPIHTLEGTQATWAVALDAEGRRVASASIRGEPEVKVIRIWDLASGAMRTLGPVEEAAAGSSGSQTDFEFLPGERLVSVGPDGLRLWDLRDGTSQLLAPSAPEPRLAVFDGGRQVAYTAEGPAVAITALDTGTTRIISSHGSGVWPVAVDPGGTVIVTGSDDGTVRVGPITGEEPHLLLGHEGRVRSVAISADGRRIASIAEDHTIRVWAMPDVSEPPLHTVPHDELLAKLRSLTNVRVVEDEESATGWTVDFEPFPGWEVLPEW